MVRKPVLVVLPLAALAAWGVVRGVLPRAAPPPAALRVSGTIEVDDVAVSFKQAGRVAARLASEGDSVTNGQCVARLDATLLDQELALRQAERAAAAAALAELEAGTRREEVAEAEAALAAARAEAARAATESARQRELAGNRVAAARDVEVAEAAAGVAAAQVRAAEARLERLRNGPRAETIAAARARAEQARQAEALAATRLADATLCAPLAGTVLTEAVEPGEYVQAGSPVITMAALERVWLRGYVSETDLGRVRLGQAVAVTADTYPGRRYPGRIVFIAPRAEFTPKHIQTTAERVKLVYRIKVAIPNPDGELKPGMPADGAIDLK